MLVVIIFAGCNKQQDNPSTTIKVLETVTNLPVNGAYVSVYKCFRYCTGAPGVGYSYSIFIDSTDVNGICHVPTQNYQDGSWITIEQPDYWKADVGKSTTVYVAPMGWLQLRIRKVHSYPSNTYFELFMSDESGRYGDSRIFTGDEAVDTLITLYAFGAQKNKIEWQLYSVYPDNTTPLANGTLDALTVPRFDTLKNVTLDY